MREFTERSKITEEGILEKKLNYRPNTAVVLSILLAAFLFYVQTVFTRILAVIILLLAFAVLFLFKDYTLIEFYSDALIITDQYDHNKALRLSYEEVESWFADTAQNKLIFTLTDGTLQEVETYRTEKAHTILNKLLPDKREKSKLEKISEKRKNKSEK